MGVSGIMFDVPSNHDSDLCVNITIMTDNIFESAELFDVTLNSNDIILCQDEDGLSVSSTGLVSIVDATCKKL